MSKKLGAFSLLFLLLCVHLSAQHSIARMWNEKVIDGIRADFARPTVHARNLFHISAAMYDAWAVYEPTADTYFLGKTIEGYTIPFQASVVVANTKEAQEEAISFSTYRLLQHRFKNAPKAMPYFQKLDAFMDSLGYDKNNLSTNYLCGAAEMGNYIAEQVIQYGLQDGANEADTYKNLYYQPVNPPMQAAISGNAFVKDLNRWQPLAFTQFIDQSGNPIGNATPSFLGAEWGNVVPFSLSESDRTQHQRNGNTYQVYYDPKSLAKLDTTNLTDTSLAYIWNYALVSIWSSQLDPRDSVQMDISPASIGRNSFYPSDAVDYPFFYDLYKGGDQSQGHPINPKTNQPYAPQMVFRGDYARVLAEFWADGPESETPPGHWFVLLNHVQDHPDFKRKFKGQGPELDPLEWDVKAYFTLGGTMHDAAITAWSIKGWYDSARPITSIRGMAELGQSSDTSLPNYHPAGLPLIPGYIEVIESGDTLAGTQGQYVGKLKLWAWRGPGFIFDAFNTIAGVGWIRAADWWPYQRPTFVSPPFAGYISGHSTYSRAAAEVLTALTGDPYFPGGMGEFFCPKNKFLVFEDGPSQNVTLQWATYQDASDQCSLSRIWGGIHPPMDDMPGRFIGSVLGKKAFGFAEQYFTKDTSQSNPPAEFTIFPNPTACALQINIDFQGIMPIKLYRSNGQLALEKTVIFNQNKGLLELNGQTAGTYILTGYGLDGKRVLTERIVLF